VGVVRFVTFGCKANQYDTQLLREALARAGWREGPEGQGEAELVVVNTCTVTAEAGRKARQLVRRVARERPGARICVTGCLAQGEPDGLRSLAGVEWVLGGEPARRPDRLLRELGCDVEPGGPGRRAGIEGFAGHARAFLKIQDGCDMACAFCVIPSVRGRSRSRPAGEVAAELRRLVQAGHAEVVLCGIHIGHWGRELALGLHDLVRELVALEPRGPDGAPLAWRLRLSSIEATEVSHELLELMAAWPRRIAPHLHLPLQSGDDEVLRRMNRWYGVAQYLAACERIRAALDRPCFSADVLVGFPGEGPRHFERTIETARAAGLARVHAFPFSARPGTAAAGMGPPPPPEVVRERRARLSALARELGAAFRRGLDGADDALVAEGATAPERAGARSGLSGLSGLSGRYQRVLLPPPASPSSAPASLPARVPAPGLIHVRLEARERPDGDFDLIGHPSPPAPRATP